MNTAHIERGGEPADIPHHAPAEREQTLREHLGRFKFSGDMVDAHIGTLSGGEKARLALALIVWDKPNLLVLDEPTNHLDMATREALSMALSSFEGALVLVSHVRYLVRSSCDRLVLVHEGRVEDYDGDLDDYARLVLEHRKTQLAQERAERAAQKADGSRDDTVNRREERRAQALERNRIAALRKPLLAKLKKIETRMDALQKTVADFDARLADADWYAASSTEEVARVTRERGVAAQELEEVELEWLDTQEAIEAAGSD